jgi:glycosyltransferase involved in cell wall biosynthesis
MKVLMISWAWRNFGGDWTYVDNVKRLYEDNGYEVIPFSTIHEDNVKNDYEQYFVNSSNYTELNRTKNISNSVNAIKNSVISVDALDKVTQLIEDHEIAFAHLHIIHHHITPGVIWKLKKAGIPIIWTLHEYKLLCPEGHFISNGKICEKCYDHKFYNCALNKCKKQSFLASTLASIDAYFYYFGNVYDNVDLFLCPSQFLLNKFEQFNFPKKKLKLTNYCYDIVGLDNQINEIELNPLPEEKQAKYIFFVGRVERLKGVFTLIQAVAGTDIVLKIAGTGQAMGEVLQYIEANNITNVEILGFQEKKNVYKLTYNALFVVCPSEWYENYPFSVIESMLISKAVVGANIGGIPELVINDETGFLFEPGNYVELQNKLLKLWNDPDLCTKFGIEGRKYAYSKVNFNTHWMILKELIKSLPIKELKPSI